MALELLAPAGNMEALVAAVQSGANAVYLGGQALNARRGAGNFDAEELKRAVTYCHERDVRVHVTVNTMVMQQELDQLRSMAEQIAEAGADAAIVQDFGVARVLRQMLPHLALHASTQMAVHNVSGVRAAKQMGFSRVVLARELTFPEIAACAKEGVEIEAFVHGALCVACSGQCLFSSMVGGRSGNRGMCAQPCRLPYRMEGAASREGYLLSPRDLMGIDHLKPLRDAGVCSLKVEGRLKRPEYVAVVISAYREALDELERGVPASNEAARKEGLRQIFNRGGFTQGYGPGVRDAELMYDRQPNHIGVPVGEAIERRRVRLSRDVDGADVLHLLAKDGAQKPVQLSGSAGQTLRVDGANAGDVLMRLTAAKQMEWARRACEGEHVLRDVDLRARFVPGEPVELIASDGVREARIAGEAVSVAQKQPASEARVRAQLEKTGGTPWRVRDLQLKLDPAAFVPASVANALRRDALAELTRRRLADMRVCDEAPGDMPDDSEMRPTADDGLIFVESGDTERLRQAVRAGADGVIYAPEDVREAALERAASRLAGLRWSLALPMVLAQSALDTLARFTERHSAEIEAVYASNAAHLAVDWPVELRGDFGLNIANRHALQALYERGIDIYTPSVELTAAQIRALGGRRTLIVHGRLPLMQLRHCPYLAAKPGTAHADCRRCDSCAPEKRIDASALIDRKGERFPLKRIATEAGCVVRVMNADGLMLLRRADRLPKAWAYRIIAEPGEDVAALVELYRDALSGRDVRGDAKFLNMDMEHTTTGHYFRGVE
ncbi:MAG: DUF3656 domain-containing protein [Clostridia bacterium]|nr:DUF3656 domain-containing protein [Clostridia bacterium]